MDSSPFSDPPPTSIQCLPAIVQAAYQVSPAAAALQYAGLGFSVLPLRGKQPNLRRWQAFQHHPAPLEILQTWVSAGRFHNVGLVCGPASGGLVVIDLDGQAAYLAFTTRFPDLADTYTVATGSGSGHHAYLFAGSLPRPSRALRTPLGNVEILSTGRQVAAPPSLHPHTRRRYTVFLAAGIKQVNDLNAISRWVEELRSHTPQRKSRIPPESAKPLTIPSSSSINPALVEALADYFRQQGYRQNREWLNGPCIYPERHAHHDRKPSFGFSTRTGYGYCWVCGSILAKDIAQQIGINPADYGGLVQTRGR
jgi:hypothetical protein